MILRCRESCFFAPLANDRSSGTRWGGLRELIQITSPVGRLHRRRRWRAPGYILKVEKFRHIHLSRIPFGEARKVEAGFHQLKPRCVVGDGVRNVILFREWRNHDQWNPIAGIDEIASRPSAFGANIPRHEVGRFYPVRTDCRLRRHVIVETTELIVT